MTSNKVAADGRFAPLRHRPRGKERKVYFTKYHPLKEQLRERTLSESDGLPYFVIYTAVCTWATSLPLEASLGLTDVISAALSTVFSIFGVIYCYFKNDGKDGFDFIKKYVVLGFITMIRCILPFFIVFVCVSLVKPILGYPIHSKVWLDILVLSMIIAFYNWRVGYHIKDTTKAMSKAEGAGLGSPGKTGER